MLTGTNRIKRALAVVALLATLCAANIVPAAQEMSLSTPGGGTMSLASLRGRVVVLLFAGVQDPQCREEIKALQSLTERYRDKEVSIFWVSINPASVASDEKLKNPCGPAAGVAVLRDSGQAVFRRFGGARPQLPTLIILDKQGGVHGKPRGGFNPDSDFVNEVASVIDGLLVRGL